MTVKRTLMPRIDRRRTVALALGLTAGVVAMVPAAARADYGDDFGLIPNTFWAGTCNLPAIEKGGPEVLDPAEDPADVQLAKRDCHKESETAPQTAVPVTQAGAHPDGSTTFEFKPVSTVPGAGGPYPDGNVKDIVVDLPPGLVGNPEATPKCPQADLPRGNCPVETQVGIVELRLSSSEVPGAPSNPQACPVAQQPRPADHPQFSLLEGNRCRFPINNLVPTPGRTATFGFMYFTGIPIMLVPSVRTDGDSGLKMIVRNVAQLPALSKSTLTLWGVPGDPKHTPFRFRPSNTPFTLPPDQAWPLHVPIRPFISNPTSCDGSQPLTTISVNSWQQPSEFQMTPNLSPPVSGCDQVPFDPGVDIEPTSGAAGSAAGLSVNLTIPQTSDPDVLATAHLKKTVVTLPEGVSVNASTASGLEGCSDAQLALGAKVEPSCPDGSKIGTAEIFTPVLPHEGEPGAPNVDGEIYLRQPRSTDPASGEMFRLAIVVRNPERDLLLKIPGSVVADPQTGRLTATFDNNPQLPFETLDVQFKGGDRGVLAMPQRCGSYPWSAELTPWSANGGGTVKTLTGTFQVTGDCSYGFSPQLRAGMSSGRAGGSGSFSFSFSRQDSEQWFRGLTAVLPPGLLASVKGVPLCSDAQANAGGCPAASRIGSVDAAAGAGMPFVLERKGDVYLTEGYKGGAYGLAVEVPVEAGPFRGAFALNTILVRQAIHVDRTDAHVTVVSDPLPTIWHGIPLRVRQIVVTVDRPGFMRNPTNCSPKQVSAQIVSTEGTAANVASPFQATGCSGLPFRPKMTMRLTGRKQTQDGRHPGMRVVVTQRPGEANLKKATVRLPLSLALDPENAESLCEFEDGKRVACAATSIIGNARAFTPLLNRPLTGPVYFVKNVRIHPRTGRPIRTLPTLLIPLRGEIALDLRANTDVESGTQKLVNTFPTIPDAPISRFELNLKGGKNGIIVVTHDKDVCGSRQVTEVDLDAQNGNRHDSNVRMATPCPKKKRARLKIAKARWQGKRVTGSGLINRAAERRVRVSVRCGNATVGKRVKPRRGRWKATLRLFGRCADVRRARVTARYAGGPRVKQARAARTIRRTSPGRS